MRKLYFRFKSIMVSGGVLKSVLCYLTLICSLHSFAQNGSFKTSGIVQDSKGEPLPGVSVVFKVAKGGTITDIEGKFSIGVTNKNVVLVFKFLGFAPVEMTADDANKNAVVMTEISSSLNEVVVIGYGTTTKRDLTGSVGVVNMQEMKKAPVPSFDQALQGRIAGVNITSSDGQPGSTSQIIIRGGSVSQDASPLFVIDGVPIENMDINSLNTNDIASIEVLKDASSIAIYGARGANGVIIISTKKGVPGATRVTYGYSYGFQKATKTIPVLSPYDYVKLELDLDSVGSTPITKVITNNLLYLNPVKGIGLDYYKNDPGYDWQNLLLRKGITETHNVNMSGGNLDTRYSISGGYYNQQGIIINTGLKRFNGSLSLDQKISQSLRTGISGTFSNTATYGTIPSAGTGGVVQAMWQFRPTKGIGNTSLLNAVIDSATLANFYNGSSTANLGDNLVNPLLQAQNEYRKNINNTSNLNAYVEYSFLKKFKLKISGGYNATNFRSETFYNSQTAQGNVIKNASGAIPNANGINGNENSGITQNYLNENILSYHNIIKKNHTLDVLVGETYQYASTAATGFRVINIPQAVEYLGIQSLSAGTAAAPSIGSSQWQLLSYLGRINYNYKERYLLTVTDRLDGSSKFATGHQWGNFPSAALGWRFIEEPLFKGIKSFLSDGKFRISYGQVGNNKVGDFSYLSQYGGYTGGAGYPLNNSYSGGVTPYFYGNSNLTWETSTELDLGLNIGFFNDRLSIETDYYDKTNSNFLLGVTMPTLGGYPGTSQYQNVGSVSNKGFELTVNTVNIQSKDFSWVSGFNVAFNTSKIINFYDGFGVKATPWNLFGQSTAWIAQAGGPISEFYGYVKTGNYQYPDFNKQANGVYVLKSGIAGYTGVQPGDPKYQDINGDGIVDLHDQTTLGSPLPIATGGLNNTFTYKQFYLSAFLQFSYGNKILNANKVAFETGNYFNQGNQFAEYVNRWTPTNPTNDIPRLIYGNTGVSRGDIGSNITRTSSWLIEDGSFLRVKTVSFGYSLPNKITKRLGIQALRFNASAQNLFTFTKYSGLDPEVSNYRTPNPSNTPGGTSSGTPVTSSGVGYTYIQPSSGYAALAQGFDFTPYPRAFTLTFGVNCTF